MEGTSTRDINMHTSVGLHQIQEAINQVITSNKPMNTRARSDKNHAICRVILLEPTSKKGAPQGVCSELQSLGTLGEVMINGSLDLHNITYHTVCAVNEAAIDELVDLILQAVN